jgi:hypothetical protein
MLCFSFLVGYPKDLFAENTLRRAGMERLGNGTT